MNDCVFCKIIKGDIPSYKIYEDNNLLVMLDINPLSKGHVLVFPKGHYENIHDIPEDVLMKLTLAVKKMSQRIKERLHPEGIIIMQNNGVKAGQSVFHFHIHIKPVYEDTPVPKEAHLRNKLTDEEFTQICRTLQ